MKLRVIFMGTSEFAVATLRALSSSHNILAVYTQPPRPAGRRGLKTVPSAVYQAANELNIQTLIPEKLRQAEYEQFLNFNADVAVVVSYGLIIPKRILDATKLGFYNGHASLLPRWRGAAPIQRAIMAGDSETGIAVMKMDEHLDTGPIALVKRIPIPCNMSAGVLHDALSIMCASTIVEVMDRLENNNISFSPQVENGITYAQKILKSETHIDFSQPSEDVHNHIRALSPLPGAWLKMMIRNRLERIKLLESQLVEGNGNPGEIINSNFTIACGQGAIRIMRLQRAGGHALDIKDFLLGYPAIVGCIVG
ncbi:methionyl-tRNA formyltransferase [Candidatus Liberibacter solanacearum]|uniref:Methionyl-tRNA formyltransferase n=1 Tax=Candidatus Liberibacter solanacearum TaxID=556287 RepID=A0A1V2N8Z1_9HYPH|nr:methionyl-tRNA formyltransferase [Candidatus Liberibacter solanacearum]ONI58580.1 methionyl-tRNA formyltransferase [Candidatus Liberibacter solanacearum]ONI60192.1 methionyl-tRNA formyltransferase [Candidatus Liberibacter solanacearum]